MRPFLDEQQVFGQPALSHHLLRFIIFQMCFPSLQIREQFFTVSIVTDSGNRNGEQQAAHAECFAEGYDRQEDQQSGYTE